MQTTNLTRCLILITFSSLLLSPHADINAQTVVQGEIIEATIYRDQARVVRSIPIPASPELQEIRVTKLPMQLDTTSVYTETTLETNVRSLRVVNSELDTTPEVADEMEKLDAKNKELTRRLENQEQLIGAIEQDLLTIEKLVDFSADKVKQNLDRATLDVDSVTALADYTMDRRRRLAAELLEAQTEVEQLTLDILENEEQQDELSKEQAESTYDAVLAIDSPAGGTIRLFYDVQNVRWQPRYSIRAVTNEDGKRTFTLHLDAVLIQNSGESWDDVAVTLSTSTPDAIADRPLLTPLRVQAVSPGEGPSQGSAQSNPNPPGWLDAEGLRRSAQLNSAANQRQVSELTTVAEVQRELAGDAGEALTDESYAVSDRVQIDNHPQIQTIAILSTQLDGKLNRVVTPLLSSFAFREAELTNTSGQNLISGAAEAYLDGEFVGRTILPPTAAGQRLKVGFGKDRKIRTRRELLNRDETVQGGNRRTTLKYRLVIANYYKEPVDIRLLDRVPIAAKDGSITVDLEPATAEKLSEDALYLRLQRPTGVLRWDLELPKERFGSNAFDFEYSYSVELDRQQTIVGSDVSQTMDDLQFEKMNMGGMGGMGGGIF